MVSIHTTHLLIMSQTPNAASAASASTTAAAQKVKTAAKQRYLKRKQRRHKILTKAKKASAPKNKQWTANGDAGSDSEEESENENAMAVDKSSPVAGPSTLPDADADVDEGELSDETSRRLRKEAKRRKREDRHKTKQDHVEVQEAPATGEQLEEEDSDIAEEHAAPLRSPSRSPTPLTAFPLPTAPDAPSASLLARQGLPAGLENATFVDQDERQPVEEVRVTTATGSVPLSDRIKKRLAAQSVSELFAGESTDACCCYQAEQSSAKSYAPPSPPRRISHTVILHPRRHSRFRTYRFRKDVGIFYTPRRDFIQQAHHSITRIDCPSHQGTGHSGSGAA